jgi:hypothetical protein
MGKDTLQAFIKILSRRLPDSAEETHGLSRGSWCHGRNPNGDIPNTGRGFELRASER